MFTGFLFSYIAVRSSLTVSYYELSAHVSDSHYYFSPTALVFSLFGFFAANLNVKQHHLKTVAT